MKRLFTLLALLLGFSCWAQTPEKGLVVVTRQNPRANEQKIVYLDAQLLVEHGAINAGRDFDVVNQNFGRRLEKTWVQQAGRIFVKLNITFDSDEPQYALALIPTDQPRPHPAEADVLQDTKLNVTYLRGWSAYQAKGNRVENWTDRIIESTLSLYPDPATLPIYAPGNYSYEYAYFLNAMFVRWQQQHKPEYLLYMRRWADRFIDSHGTLNSKFYNVAEYRLDDLLPGRLFLSLYDVTRDSRYKGAAEHLKAQLQYQPRTSDGGYWHKQAYPYQMWLDGIYMADVFMMQYASMMKEPALFQESMRQIRLVHQYNGDPKTGLLYHGWDESLNDVWANEETGTSPEFWSRGIGWYLMSLLECIDYVPLESPDRKELGMLFRELTRSVLKYQDAKSGLWYQVTNKSYEPRNWFETSASAMFAYAFAKGYRKGILDKTYLDAANKTFETLKKEYLFFDDQGRIYLDGTVKIGTLNPKVSKGDLDYYVSTERRINDYKGLGSLLYLTVELGK